MNIKEMLTGSIHRMSHVYRFSSVPTIRRENVAEHSWYVAMYAYLIGRELQASGHTVDMGKLLSRALVHDLDESMTGDFLRYVKYGHPDLKRALDEVSVRMLKQMTKDLGFGSDSVILSDWESAKGDDIEGAILKIVDLVRVLAYVMEEVRLGNRHIASVINECSAYISSVMNEVGRTSPLFEYGVAILAEVERWSTVNDI